MAFTESKKTALAKPATKRRSKAPRAHEWQVGLRELPREAGLMLEDFGMTKSTLNRYAEAAARGDKKAIDKIEPLRQFFFTLMGLDKEMRRVRDEESGSFVFELDEYGDRHHVKEERSRWAMREGYDMYTEGKSRRPRPAMLREKIDEHFYALCPLLEFVKQAAPLKLHGRAHPNPEDFKAAHHFLAGGGHAELKAFADGKKAELSKAMDAVIERTDNPARRDTLELLKPYLLEDKQSDWDGLN